jgi:AcrR family transcriptional regulator
MPRTSLTPATVVDAAAMLADEEGLDAVTVSALARRLGVQTPSLYSHVRDHAAVVDGITVIALSELSTRIAEATAGRAGRAALRGFAETYRTYAQQHPGRWQSLQRRAGPDAVRSDAARTLVALTDAVLLGYELPASERVHAIRMMGSAIGGFLALERIGSFDHSDPAPDESWDRMIDALDTLLWAWPPAQQKTADTEGRPRP